MTHHFILFIFYHQHTSEDRSVSIVSHYRWDNSIPNRGIDCFHEFNDHGDLLR
jgi:hypothetical protein